VKDFIKVLEKKNLDCTKNDEWSWIDDKVNTYSVKSAYEIIRNLNPEKKKTIYRTLKNKNYTNCCTFYLKNVD